MLITGERFGFTGLVIRCIRAWSGVRPPFFTLHRTQQQTMLSQLALPPWLFGTTWSSDSSVVENYGLTVVHGLGDIHVVRRLSPNKA